MSIRSKLVSIAVPAAAEAAVPPCSYTTGWSPSGKAQSYTQKQGLGCLKVAARHSFHTPGNSTVYYTAWSRTPDTYTTIAWSPVSASPYTLIAKYGQGTTA